VIFSARAWLMFFIAFSRSVHVVHVSISGQLKFDAGSSDILKPEKSF
jgi:hypothetical protein